MNGFPLQSSKTRPRIGVIGAGLIGGSIVKRAVRAGYPTLVHDRDNSIVEDVVKHGAGFAHLLKHFADVDIIFIAVPVSEFASVLEQLTPHLRPGQVISDVSSTKQSPMAALATAPTGVTVVGGHPMAGSSESGWTASRADLFDGCVWVLCPTGDHSVPVAMMQLIIDLGAARTIITTAEEHDRAVAAISHGVQVAASSLAAAVLDVINDEELPWLLAAGGFRDTTRIAESSPTMWTPVLLENAVNVNAVVRAEIARLEAFSAALSTGDGDALTALIEDGQNARNAWKDAKAS